METVAEEAAARPRASREALRALTAKLLMAVHLAQTISEEVKLYQSSGPVRFDVGVATSRVRVQTASAISATCCRTWVLSMPGRLKPAGTLAIVSREQSRA
jgi:hypothetical protein